jgi:hypothetical protein
MSSQKLKRSDYSRGAHRYGHEVLCKAVRILIVHREDVRFRVAQAMLELANIGEQHLPPHLFRRLLQIRREARARNPDPRQVRKGPSARLAAKIAELKFDSELVLRSSRVEDGEWPDS